MKRRSILPPVTLALAVAVLALGINRSQGAGFRPGPRLITGDVQQVGGAQVSTFANVSATREVLEAGLILPFAVVSNPPTDGTGPAGAFAVLPFPDVVQQTTFFNHAEVQWEPYGHPPIRYFAPHLDFHFYNMTVDQVLQVGSFDPAQPLGDHIPYGFLYPGPQASVPQMGVHAMPFADVLANTPFTGPTMLAGYYGGRTTFVEPMVPQVFLARRRTFQLPVPQPPVLGISTRYPTRFVATADRRRAAFVMTFSRFVQVDR